ncbi:MAG: hypothetical protein KatS3mg114_0017 [Planctomycetaceae bacterium]|nr:MAG: hypothetical protein KatS3mg114_0017 [Planctomycetaceae bacterium]
MAVIHETSGHVLFLVERRGNTLVVRPRGDAVGFTSQTLQLERDNLLQLAQQPRFHHLIIDLSLGNYFGSLVIGVLVQLAQVIHAKQGIVATAGASAEMQDVLRILKLEQFGVHYRSLQEAIRHIATIPLHERLWHVRYRLLTIALLGLALAVIIWYPRPSYAKRYYLELVDLWKEAQEKIDLAGDEEWQRFIKKSHVKLAPILKYLLKRSSATAWNEQEAERYLVAIIRDHWDHALDRFHPYRQGHQQAIEHYLRGIEALLEGRAPPPLLHDIPLGDYTLRGIHSKPTPQILSTPGTANMNPSPSSAIPEQPSSPPPGPAPTTQEQPVPQAPPDASTPTTTQSPLE